MALQGLGAYDNVNPGLVIMLLLTNKYTCIMYSYFTLWLSLVSLGIAVY